MIQGNLIAAAAIIAGFVGAACGAGVMRSIWVEKYQAREIELLNQQMQAVEAARKVTREVRDAAAAIRNAPVRRVRCEPANSGLPGSDAGPDVGDLPGGRASRDYGPALREILAGAAQLNRIHELQATNKN